MDLPPGDAGQRAGRCCRAPSSASAARALPLLGGRAPVSGAIAHRMSAAIPTLKAGQGQGRQLLHRDADEEERSAPQQGQKGQQSPFSHRHRALRDRHRRLSKLVSSRRLAARAWRVRPFPALQFQRRATGGKRAIASRSSRSIELRTYCFDGVAERLEIPRLDLALAERGVDEPAPALAHAHAGVQFGEVPALGDLGAKVGDERRASPDRPRGSSRSPGSLRKVVELVGVGGRVNEFECAAADHHHRRDRPFGQIFADRLVMSACAAEMGRKAASVDAGCRAIACSRPKARRASA